MNIIRFADLCAQEKAQGQRVFIRADLNVPFDDHGHITTLGRGGSDTSAVAVAAAMNAQECLIYTDVDGVYTTDPRIVPEARRLRVISFEEMLMMFLLGLGYII